ncbi:hypothetical protein [Salegentibacter chungangensis]|uniref:DUF91 domain-containing protein n=1 Tax=Salegentibacter chungangensis TaxID=1335724 RepID=A0ABW3NR15_9FLAO
MATHILTVNETTFPIHLRYMFIGTGKNGSPHQTGALADIFSIREGDNIIFYVMQRGFFGIFKATGEVFYDYESYDGYHPQYLNDDLGGKTLTYRMKIEPNEVYENYISEWDMMENPENIKDNSIFNLQWSWIFKKLKGNRGCVSIDETEFELFQSNLAKNNNTIAKSGCYDYVNGKIKSLNTGVLYHEECTTKPPRSVERLNKIYREEDLRILFTAYANNHGVLNQVLKPHNNGNVNFIANEIACSFSERRMDLLFGTDQNNCILIELKNDFLFNENIYNQIQEYSRWISAYKDYTEIIPILILKSPRQVRPSRRGKYFKFLSENDKRENNFSPWYKAMIEKIENGKKELSNEGIRKTADLQVYLFETGSGNELIKFNQLF